MRYYSLQITDPDGTSFATYTSFVNGKTDLGALQIEFDVPVTTLATPIGAASVKLWGVSLQTIGQASDFNGKTLRLYAGMQAGLPLANPAQAGLVVQGTIYQAFGNWIETAQWVEFIVVTDGGVLDQKLNITLDWKAGTPLAQAVQQTLSVALPSFGLDVNISQDLVLPADEKGYYGSLTQFSQYLKQASAAILGGDYSGVDILVTENTFRVFDGTSSTAPKQISFTDLVGQPTWVDPGTVQVTVVLRADLEPTDYIQLPKTQITVAPADNLVALKDRSVFQGSFLIKEMRHIGNFRQPDALGWVTTMNCSPTKMAA